MLRYRLADADRERLGAPEWLELDTDRYPVDLAEAIEAAGGDWSALFSVAFPIRAQRLQVWAALRNAGIDVDLAELAYDLVGLRCEMTPKELLPGTDVSTAPDSSPTSD